MATIVPKTWKAKRKDPKTGAETVATRKGFQVQIRLKGFPVVYETFESKRDAKEWAQKTEADMKAGRHFPERRAAGRTLAELVDRYVAEVCPEKKSGPHTERLLGWWKTEHGYRVLADLTPEVLAEIRDALAAKSNDQGRRNEGKRISGSTVNRYMAALSHALTMASREWGWIRDNPMRRVTKKKEGRGRVRILTDSERERLLTACRASGAWYLEPVVILALATGMRQGEILGLRWPDVDLKRDRLVLDDTKNGDRRGIALAGPARDVLAELSKLRRVDTDEVFPETSSFRWAWLRAVRRAKVLDFRFHDLRHTCASFLAMNGATPSEIAAVLGHRTLAMVKRYAHLHDEHIEGVMSRMADRFLADVKASPIVKGPTKGADVVPIRRRRASS